ncbi:YcaO-like family protein [Thauera sp. SWB20]|uniref:YcaO-like family protein n=1 Tax=Thauera sp. SWB20 TaxID=1572758 RepID=UPI0005ADF3C2|nr:YcaO-like family protein [Thauera sp. SWB20]KIN88841.1 hypothetical protein PO78_226 [Thauera sp. SWB20]
MTTESSSAVIRLGSSLRTRRAEETFSAIRPHLASVGISRVTDTTRMDRLGLPVFASIRPRGKVLRVHAGKGTELIDAKVGAAMEAIEYALAEPEATEWSPVCTSVGELLKSLPLRFIDFAPRLGVNVSESDMIHGVTCEDLSAGHTSVIPAQLVFMPYLPAGCKNFFGGTTNGLASGNSVPEATVHAIFEVLERDVVSMNKVQDRSLLIDPRTLPDIFRQYSDQWKSLGVSLAVRYIGNTYQLPCFQAFLTEEESNTVNLSTGQGLHSDAEIALSRAICEAAQSRLSHIHGGRDDITHFYSKYARWDKSDRARVESEVKRRAFDAAGMLSFHEVLAPAQYRDETMSEIIARLVHIVHRNNLGPIYRYTFDHDIPSISVVKVVVPRAEHIEHNLKRMGPRVFAAVTARA